jgi:hypothetical protein
MSVVDVFCVCHLRRLGREKPGKYRVALTGKGEVLLGNSSFIMRRERQRHFVEMNGDIRVVIALLCLPGDPVDEIDAVWESIELKCPQNRLRASRPVRDGLQAKRDLFAG